MKILPNQWIESMGCSSFDIEVLLDGILQKYCTEADDEAGYVIRYTGLDPRDTEIVKGHVEFRRKRKTV